MVVTNFGLVVIVVYFNIHDAVTAIGTCIAGQGRCSHLHTLGILPTPLVPVRLPRQLLELLGELVPLLNQHVSDSLDLRRAF